MGSGASSLVRLRKAILIRAYNLRKPDETLDDQFRKYSYRNSENQVSISISDVKQCLCMEPGEYLWIEDLFRHTTDSPDPVVEINFLDLIRFLENGKMPGSSPGRASTNTPRSTNGTPRSKPVSNGNSANLDTLRTKRESGDHKLPPFPPVNGNNSSNVQYHVSERLDGIATSTSDLPHAEEEVMHINLTGIAEGSVYSHQLPDSVKLHSSNSFTMRTRTSSDPTHDDDETPLTVIVHPKLNKAGRGGDNGEVAEVKALWRKREVVRQERTVHYTTMDAEGELQELVEKETTQTEILHMECRETGEFAHRETTKYEQIETFNEDVVAEVTGAEEYVHLKSLEDEFHYMESTMPEGKGSNAQSAAGGSGGEEKKHGGEEDDEVREMEGGFEEGREMTHEEAEEEQRQYEAYIAARRREEEGGGEGEGRGEEDDGQHLQQDAEGDPGENAALEDYGFDVDRFAARTTTGSSVPPSPSVHSAQYHLDPAYCSEEEMAAAAASNKSAKSVPLGGRHELFGDKVHLDSHYGGESTSSCDLSASPRGSRRPSINSKDVKGANDERVSIARDAQTDSESKNSDSDLTCGMPRNSSSYESMHEID